MKRLTCLICLIMALVSPCALAHDAEAAPTLWPACDPATGQWGAAWITGGIMSGRRG